MGIVVSCRMYISSAVLKRAESGLLRWFMQDSGLDRVGVSTEDLALNPSLNSEP